MPHIKGNFIYDGTSTEGHWGEFLPYIEWWKKFSHCTYTSIYSWLIFKFERQNYTFSEENKGPMFMTSRLEKIFLMRHNKASSKGTTKNH